MLNSSLLKEQEYVPPPRPSSETKTKMEQHTSVPLKNACSRAKIGAFFVNGTLPGNDSYCPLEAGPWNITIAGPLAKRSDILEISELIRGLGRS
jgi:hypothetical protein